MTKRNIGTLSAAMLCGVVSFAQQNSTTKSISIFKNGQSFIVKEAAVDAENGMYKMTKLPNALFGTYWFSGITGSITSVSSRMEDFVEKKERKANSFMELLHANKGSEITVNTNDNKTYKGVVEDFDLPEEINSKIQLQQMQLSDDYEGLYGFDRIFTAAAPVLLLKMDGKWLSIEPSTIKSIEFSQKPNRTTTAHITVQKPILTVHFEKAGHQDFRYMYLQTGLSWVPVYKMKLLSETEAELNLQAEVTNKVEDINHTDVDFVVGVPNFSQANGLATILNYDKNTGGYAAPVANQYRNSLSDKMVLAEVAMTGAPSPTNVTGAENEDLYFYTLKDMTLEKGGRAQFPLFSQKVRISHFYRCDLPVSPFTNYQLNAETEPQENTEEDDAMGQDKPFTVGHYIELYNNSNNPFTSGAILMLKGKTDEAIAQDILPFTPKDNHSSIYVTSAPDIVVHEEEKIATIKRASKKVDNYSYALLTIKGTIKLQNSKSKTVDLKLRKPLTGKMLSCSVKYTTSVNQQNNYPRTGNTNQTVTMSTSIAAGEKQSIAYTYQIYVRE